jgi:hypothetical protein
MVAPEGAGEDPALVGEAPGPVADGLLDEAVGGLGQRQRDRDPGEVEHRRAPVEPIRAHEHDDRPVPQVEGVGDHAGVAADGVAEDPRQRTPLGPRAPEDEHRRGDGDQQEAAVGVDGAAAVAEEEHHGHQPAERRGAEPPGHRSGPRGVPPLVPEDEGQHHADDEALAPRVGAVVGPREVDVAQRQVAHPPGRGEQGHQQHREHQPAPQAGERRQAEEEQGPHQVELLLDRQRPRVAQRRHVEAREVRLRGEDEPPVGHVEERGQPIAAQPLNSFEPPSAPAMANTPNSVTTSAGPSRRTRREKKRRRSSRPVSRRSFSSRVVMRYPDSTKKKSIDTHAPGSFVMPSRW